MRLCLLMLLIVLLAGCVPEPGSDAAPVQPKIIKPPNVAVQSAWLNPAQPLDSEVRLKTPDGIDLRQACYVPALEQGETEHAILARTRNYSDRTPGEPDRQILTRFQPTSGAQSELKLPKGYPVNVLVDPEHTEWAVVALTPSAEQELHDADFSVFTPDGSGGLAGMLIPEWQYPRALQAGWLGCNHTSAIQLNGGLINVSWLSESLAQAVALPGTDAPGYALGFGLQSDAGGIADYTVHFDPVHPDGAFIGYNLTLGYDRDALNHTYEYPYHVTYSTSAWEPPLLWVDGTRLATLLFQPGATGHSRRANHNGLFRLVTLDAESGDVTLIEDHLDAHLPIITADGVLFYVRQCPGEDAPAWEVWVASANGLSKRRVLREPNAMYLSVEDALPERLLVQRQYMEVVDDIPHLYSELREFSLIPLHPGQIELAGVNGLDLLAPSTGDGLTTTPGKDEDATLPPTPPAGTLRVP